MTKKDRKRKEWILSQAENDKKRKCHSRESGNPGSISCNSGLDAKSKVYSFLLVLKKNKKKVWIPNQVGDDSGGSFRG